MGSYAGLHTRKDEQTANICYSRECIMNEQKEKFGLTHPQQRIWYTEKLHPGTGMWNNAGTLKVKGRLDYPLLEKAVNMFINDNESARLRIGVKDNAPYQYIADYKPLKLDLLDFTERT